MKNKLSLLFILVALTLGCKKDTQQVNQSKESTSKIERDSLFLQWGQSANGRWIKYSLEKVDRNSLNKENVFSALNSSVKSVYNARKHYENLLLEKYGNGIGNFNNYLDSLYRKNYDKINSSLEKRSVMDNLYLQYGKLIPSTRASRLMASAKMSIGDDETDLPEVIINACQVPQDLVNFYKYYLDPNLIFPFTPVGSTKEITDCMIKNLNEISSNIRMLRPANNPDGIGCAFYKDRAYDALLKYYQCDIKNPFPGTSPSDPFPPGGGGSGGTGSQGTSAKIEQLTYELDKDPNFLIDCALLEKFKSFVNYAPPQSVFNRIDDLNANTLIPTLFSNAYFVQQIKNGAGYKINLDRFEINVNTLPVVNGVRLTADQFLNYIRHNFNDFFDTSITKFMPYVDPDDFIQDKERWESNSPLGAILHIEMQDDGAVIVSDFASNYWTVSTLRTPMDGAHPVSGNRKWGYEFGNSTNFNGYTFYVTGVDRLTTGRHEFVQYLLGTPFSKADQLWESYQNKVSQFVNNHSGVASIGAQIKERPNYDAIKDYLDGRISLQQLKDMKGCK